MKDKQKPQAWRTVFKDGKYLTYPTEASDDLIALAEACAKAMGKRSASKKPQDESPTKASGHERKKSK